MSREIKYVKLHRVAIELKEPDKFKEFYGNDYKDLLSYMVDSLELGIVIYYKFDVKAGKKQFMDDNVEIVIHLLADLFSLILKLGEFVSLDKVLLDDIKIIGKALVLDFREVK